MTTAFLRGAIPLLLLAIVVSALLMFGIISLATSLWVALGVALAVVSLAFLFKGPPHLALTLLAGGLALMLFNDSLPSLTLGNALTLGANP